MLLAGVEADGWELASDYRPARQIGGDFFDVWTIPDRPRSLGVVIADVSGKGIAAALLMAFLRPLIRSALDFTGDPVVALERTNWILVNERRTGLFVTVICGVLDLDSGVFSFANAGHEMPLLAPEGGAEPTWVQGCGPLVGMFGRLDLTLEQVEIRPADRLVLFTDGLTDAKAPGGERFGMDRLRDTIRASCVGNAEQTANDVIGAVLDFQGEADPADDLALLVLYRTREAR